MARTARCTYAIKPVHTFFWLRRADPSSSMTQQNAKKTLTLSSRREIKRTLQPDSLPSVARRLSGIFYWLEWQAHSIDWVEADAYFLMTSYGESCEKKGDNPLEYSRTAAFFLAPAALRNHAIVSRGSTPSRRLAGQANEKIRITFVRPKQRNAGSLLRSSLHCWNHALCLTSRLTCKPSGLSGRSDVRHSWALSPAAFSPYRTRVEDPPVWPRPAHYTTHTPGFMWHSHIPITHSTGLLD